MARVHADDPGAQGMLCIDADTGERIHGVVWADPETGEYAAWNLDEKGWPIGDLDENNQLPTTVKRGNIRLERI